MPGGLMHMSITGASQLQLWVTTQWCCFSIVSTPYESFSSTLGLLPYRLGFYLQGVDYRALKNHCITPLVWKECGSV